MKHFKQVSKRWFAMLLTLVMAMGMVQTTAFAADADDGITRSAFEYAQNLDQGATCRGTVALNGKPATDSGTPNVWPTGNWGGSVDVTGYKWVHITNSDPNVATVSYKTEGGKLSITFTPGTQAGTTKVSVGVDAKYLHYSLGPWNMELNFDYTVTNNGGGDEPTPGGDKPSKPTVNDLPTTKQSGYVYVKCVSYPNSDPRYNSRRTHAGYMSLANSTDGWSFGEVYANDGRYNSDGITADKYPWFCDLTINQEWYLNRWNSNYSANEGTHYLANSNEAVVATFVSDGTEWYFFTEDFPLVVWTTHENQTPPPTYTVTYTDGVAGEIVFADQSTEGLEEGELTPAFTMAAKGTETLDDGTVQPKREGYTFMGWAPAVNPFVSADDADGNGNIIYTATWQKDALKDLTVSKTPSEEYPIVGDEFRYTIRVTNPNSEAVTVKITDRLNEKLDYVSSSDHGTYDKDTHTVTWTNVNVPANGYKEVNISVKANAVGDVGADGKDLGVYNEAKAEWETGSASGNTTVYPQEPDPIPTTYTVVHKYYTNGEPDGSTQENKNGYVGDVVSETDITKVYTYTKNDVESTYEFTSFTPKLPHTLVDGTNTIILRYDRTVEVEGDDDDDTDKEVSYTVQWYVVGEDTPFKEDTTRTGTVGAEVSVTDADKKVEGYTFVPDCPDNVLSDTLKEDGSTVLKLYFTKNEEQPKDPANYKVVCEYYFDSVDFDNMVGLSTKDLVDANVGDTIYGANLASKHPEWTKCTPWDSTEELTFTYVNSNPESIVLDNTTGSITLRYVYTKDEPAPEGKLTVTKDGTKRLEKDGCYVDYIVTVTNGLEKPQYFIQLQDVLQKGLNFVTNEEDGTLANMTASFSKKDGTTYTFADSGSWINAYDIEDGHSQLNKNNTEARILFLLDEDTGYFETGDVLTVKYTAKADPGIKISEVTKYYNHVYVTTWDAPDAQ